MIFLLGQHLADSTSLILGFGFKYGSPCSERNVTHSKLFSVITHEDLNYYQLPDFEL